MIIIVYRKKDGRNYVTQAQAAEWSETSIYWENHQGDSFSLRFEDVIELGIIINDKTFTIIEEE